MGSNILFRVEEDQIMQRLQDNLVQSPIMKENKLNVELNETPRGILQKDTINAVLQDSSSLFSNNKSKENKSFMNPRKRWLEGSSDEEDAT